MQIETGYNPNCSEAVFRFYTDEPEVAQRIVQAFIDATTDEWNKHLCSGEKKRKRVKVKFDWMDELNGVYLPGINHNLDCIWEPGNNSFVLRVGNNNITEADVSETLWKKVFREDIEIEEAETSKELNTYARDCTCGITYLDGYPKAKRDAPAVPIAPLEMLHTVTRGGRS